MKKIKSIGFFKEGMELSLYGNKKIFFEIPEMGIKINIEKIYPGIIVKSPIKEDFKIYFTKRYIPVIKEAGNSLLKEASITINTCPSCKTEIFLSSGDTCPECKTFIKFKDNEYIPHLENTIILDSIKKIESLDDAYNRLSKLIKEDGIMPGTIYNVYMANRPIHTSRVVRSILSNIQKYQGV